MYILTKRIIDLLISFTALIMFLPLFLIVIIIFSIFFKHNWLNQIIISVSDPFTQNVFEYSSEVSLLLLIILSIYSSILIYKNNLLFKIQIYWIFIKENKV